MQKVVLSLSSWLLLSCVANRAAENSTIVAQFEKHKSALEQVSRLAVTYEYLDEFLEKEWQEKTHVNFTDEQAAMVMSGSISGILNSIKINRISEQSQPNYIKSCRWTDDLKKMDQYKTTNNTIRAFQVFMYQFLSK